MAGVTSSNVFERWLSRKTRTMWPNYDNLRTKDSSYSYVLLLGACISCMCNVGTLQTFGIHYATLVKEFGGNEAITGTGNKSQTINEKIAILTVIVIILFYKPRA